jgi:hypothetical protein
LEKNMASNIEKRLLELEAKVERMEARRRKIIPAEFDSELDSNEGLQELQRKAVQSALSKWQLTLAEHGDPTAARFCELKDTLLREMALQAAAIKQREEAEIVAVIEHYEATGESLPGYEVIDGRGNSVA